MKFLCILWDICGVYALFKLIAESRGDTAYILGAVIGFAIFCVLPTYFCFREEEGNRSNRPSYRPTTPKSVQKTTTYVPSANLISKEFRNETYFQRLKRLCNPQNFVENYDKEKVDIANSLYSKLLNTNKDDKATIDELIVDAEEKLHINLLDEVELDRLTNKINPKNFMQLQPYDAEKVALSNELYAKITHPDINLTEFLRIKQQAKPLTDYLEQVQKKK